MKKRIFCCLLSLILLLPMVSAFAADDGPMSESMIASIAAKVNGTKIIRLTEEPVTLTAWIRVDNNGATNLIESVNEMELLAIMEEKTGVRLELKPAPIGQELENFSLMLASGNYPDIICNFNDFYKKGGDAAIEEGILIDLNDLIEQYAPNYSAARKYSEARQKATLTDAGQQPFFCSFNYQDEESVSAGGPIIRKDLLEKLQMDMPVTFDDLHDFLYACVHTLGLKRAFGMNNDGMFKYNGFTPGFDFALSWIPVYQKNGIIQYAPLTEEYKNYLTTMAAWYKEGLIDPDFPSTITFDDGLALATSGDCAVTADHGGLMTLFNSMGKEENPDFEFTATLNPVLKEGDIIHNYNPTGSLANAICGISTKCSDPALAVAYLDQFYSDEGFLLCNYGTEGKTYEWKDGKPVFTDFVLHNEKGTNRDVLSAYAAPTVWFYEVVANRMADEATLERAALWNSNVDNSCQFPSGVTLSSEENEIYSELYPEIQSYVKEMTVKFIMNLEPMENYDEFINNLHGLGIDDVIAAYQSAYDRYMAR